MNGPIRRIALSIFVLFGLLLSAVTYFQIVVGPDYRDNPRNLRVIAGKAGKERGIIVTIDGTVIARSVSNPDDSRVFRRSYPEENLYSHAVGYATLLFGESGLEETQADVLVSDRDSTISGVIQALLGKNIRPEGIVLTINHRLQKAAYEAIDGHTGAIVAIDPTTGAILAMVSKPDFNPNLLLGTSAGSYGDELAARPDRPLLNRAIREVYAPGSTFKVITAAAALENGTVGPGTTFPNPVHLNLPGTSATIRNFGRSRCGSEATISLNEAMSLSCNTTFGMIGLEIGAGQLTAMASAFGFGLKIPFDLTTAESSIPTIAAFENDLPAVAQSAIGQRDVRATPIQMALVAAAVANDGWIMSPYLTEKIFDSSGEVTRHTTPIEWRRAVSPSTAEALSGFMESTITSGTGNQAAVPGIRIAGKTGTAEVPGASPNAWFIGFGPVQATTGTAKIAIAVMIEDIEKGGTGGTVAAPIAREVLEAFFSD